MKSGYPALPISPGASPSEPSGYVAQFTPQLTSKAFGRRLPVQTVESDWDSKPRGIHVPDDRRGGTKPREDHHLSAPTASSCREHPSRHKISDFYAAGGLLYFLPSGKRMVLFQSKNCQRFGRITPPKRFLFHTIWIFASPLGAHDPFNVAHELHRHEAALVSVYPIQ